MNRKAFYDAIRKDVNLTEENVFGMERLLDYAEAHGARYTDLPYIIATAWWETGATMQPVRETYWKDEEWRRKYLAQYYPYYGRGLVQTTWRSNYEKIGKLLGIDAVRNPDLLLEWNHALPALFIGMMNGLYTGKKLSDYIDGLDESDDEDYLEYLNARRIVNGTDRADEIAKLALTFEKGLLVSGYGIPVKDIDEVLDELPALKPMNWPRIVGGTLFAIFAALVIFWFILQRT